ncbi:MFS general substrate transporter [Phanerochaete sordida]|uniref:MFS general substrate transporter n=1 Tax=Phanerochaete sordida TaxID=48140 RepID=A0A9P3LKR7_9APHY|nr:MFS general substrate transporter [Phanerochaete sordida]
MKALPLCQYKRDHQSKTYGHDTVHIDEVSSTTISQNISEKGSALSPSVPGDPTLPPVDRGFSAWATVAASSLLGFFVWGFPNSSGALLAAYLKDPVYTSQKGSSSILPLVGTLSTGVLYCSGIIIHPAIHYYPRLRKVFTWLGIVICTASLLGASFTTKVTTLMALQGILFAIGASLVYYPILSYLSEWFVRRRGLASGIVVAADNAGGVLFPVVVPALLARVGIQTTTRIYAVALAVCLLPAAPFMRPRLPEPWAREKHQRSTGRAWARDRRFWFFVAMNAVQGFAHFVPLTWLPTFATTLGLSTGQASLALTLSNAAAIFSGFGVGWLSDRVGIWALSFVVLLLSALATFVLWGVAGATYAGVLAFGVVYGLTAGSWSSLWSGFVRPIAGGDPAGAATIINCMMLSRGIGNIVSTPIATALQRVHAGNVAAGAASRTGFAVDGGRYDAVIIYTGACFAMGAAVALVGWAFDRKSTRRESR